MLFLENIIYNIIVDILRKNWSRATENRYFHTSKHLNITLSFIITIVIEPDIYYKRLINYLFRYLSAYPHIDVSTINYTILL